MAPDTNISQLCARLRATSGPAHEHHVSGPANGRTGGPGVAPPPARGEVIGWWKCPMCERQVAHLYRPGRRRIYCSNGCRQQAYRRRRAQRAGTPATPQRPAERTITFEKRHARRDRRDHLLHHRRDSRRRVVTACGTFAIPARERAVTHTDFLPDHPWSCATCIAILRAGHGTSSGAERG